MSEENKIKHGKMVWAEDDVLRIYRDPRRETLEKKWQGLFGEELDKQKSVLFHDGGDHGMYLMPNGYVIVCACDGDYLYEPSAEVANGGGGTRRSVASGPRSR